MGVGEALAVLVGVGEALAVLVGVGLGETVGVTEGVGVALGEAEGDAELDGVGDTAGVGVGEALAARLTRILTLVVTGRKLARSSGVKVTVSSLIPLGRIVPATGEYEYFPGIEAFAFSCSGPSGVPAAIEAGRGQSRATLRSATLTLLNTVSETFASPSSNCLVDGWKALILQTPSATAVIRRCESMVQILLGDADG